MMAIVIEFEGGLICRCGTIGRRDRIRSRDRSPVLLSGAYMAAYVEGNISRCSALTISCAEVVEHDPRPQTMAPEEID
jgi:hypothetical protein